MYLCGGHQNSVVDEIMRWRCVTVASTLAVAGSEYVVGTSDVCRDLESNCAQWAASGECQRNVGFMKLWSCRVSCGSCGLDVADLSPIAIVNESFMAIPRRYGTCSSDIPQKRLRWGADASLASQIGCFNRAGAEPKGSWERTGLVKAASRKQEGSITFYDTVSAKPLFVAPRNRTMADFLAESKVHGWPSFRDAELVLDNLRQVRGTRGEIVSVDGLHLGHNLPDGQNRYCINLVSIAGRAPLMEALNSRHATYTDDAPEIGRSARDASTRLPPPPPPPLPKEQPLQEELPARRVEL